MTKQQFSELCNCNLVFLDGATGSNLIKRGMPAGVCPEEWILSNKEALMFLNVKKYAKTLAEWIKCL